MMRSLPSARHSPGQAPCTESRRNSRALDSASARSLIETSSSPLSAFWSRARATRRPIRPKPLIATLVAMSLISLRFQGRENLRHDSLGGEAEALEQIDRKSTRLNSSHGYISYAVFCLKKKKKKKRNI